MSGASGATGKDLAQRIDDIERGYEYLLAFAAQGRADEQGSDARKFLEQMKAALDGLPALAEEAVRVALPAATSDAAPFVEALRRDAVTAGGAVSLVLARASISSMLVDNLNASVHLRALLTDLFLLEQWLRP